jgi:hypothetical protein
MVHATLPLLSTETYILFSFMAFIVYVFLYLSFLGLLKGGKDNIQNRPHLAGFESMRNSDFRITRQDRNQIDELRNPRDETGEYSPFFDHTATFSSTSLEAGSNDNNSIPADVAAADPFGSVESEEEEDDFPWPEPEGHPASMEDSAGYGEVIGDLMPEELVFVSQLRASMEDDGEVYRALLSEYREVEGKVARLVHQTNEAAVLIVSNHLDSREKVIFNLRSAFGEDAPV